MTPLRHPLTSLGASLVLVGAAMLGIASQASGQTDNVDSLALFAVTAPVYQHPRCLNCHGGTNPQTGANHGGGVVESKQDASSSDPVCLTCHDAGVQTRTVPGDPLIGTDAHTVTNGPWRLAGLSDELNWVGLDTAALCERIASVNGLRTGDAAAGSAFGSHIRGDPLIGLGFEGKGGITDNSPVGPVDTDPPIMSREEFDAATRRWVVDGHAECKTGDAIGTITVTSGSQPGQTQPDTESVISTGTWTWTIDRVLSRLTETDVSGPLAHDEYAMGALGGDIYSIGGNSPGYLEDNSDSFIDYNVLASWQANYQWNWTLPCGNGKFGSSNGNASANGEQELEILVDLHPGHPHAFILWPPFNRHYRYKTKQAGHPELNFPNARPGIQYTMKNPCGHPGDDWPTSWKTPAAVSDALGLGSDKPPYQLAGSYALPDGWSSGGSNERELAWQLTLP